MRRGKATAFQEKFQKLNCACAQHNGDCKEEGEFRRRRTGNKKKERADNGNARTGSAGDYGKQLETADKESGFIGNFRCFVDRWRAVLCEFFNE